MAHPSVQTIRLARGKHHAPGSGVCVMELASMLAEEPFGDRCATVCPSIGAFLRGYNDQVDERRLQSLIPYAAHIVGTASGERIAGARAAMCFEFAWQAHRSLRTLRRSPRFPYAERDQNVELAGAIAGRAARRSAQWHRDALAFVDALIALGRPLAWRPALHAPEADLRESACADPPRP